MTQERLWQVLDPSWADPRTLSALLCGSAAAVVLLKWLGRRQIQQKMEEARRTRDLALERMEKAARRFKQENPGTQTAHILSLTMVELAEKLKEGSLSPESVLYSYMGKALEVTREVNCVVDFIHGCEDQLQKLKKQKEKGLLYGIPVSIKDHINCKGHVSSGGMVKFLGQVKEEDSVVVQVLKSQGAIPFVKTNIPQTMINYDCSNLIFGQTLNPLNHQKSPGGSSGGEGALIAGGGSILGIGSDVAGSIRLPSSFCGLCGLKPTGNRISKLGVVSSITGMKSVTGMLGPMARDVDSLALCMKALLCEEMFRLDPTLPPLPFDEEVYTSSKPLRIGYYEGDGYFQPSPSMKRAVQQTRKLLQDAGHTLVPFAPPKIDYVVDELFTRGIFSDGAAHMVDCFKGDIVDPNLKSQYNTYRLPALLKKILAIILKPFYPRIARDLSALCGVGSAKNLWDQHGAVEIYRTEFIAKWRKLRLDVILCPALGPAFNHGYAGKLFAATSYTNLYNVLNFPAGVVPVSTVTRADEEELKHYRGHYGDPWDQRLKEAVEGAVGLPVAVQCVALPWQEELCLRFMKEVEMLVHDTKRNVWGGKEGLLLLPWFSFSLHPWRPEDHMMIQQQLRQLLPEREVEPSAALTLLCGSAAAVVVWKWLGKRQVQKRMEEARRTRDEGVKKMAKAVQQFREQVPSVQTDAILSLPLLELAERLREGSLSPRAVLYTYLEKALEVTQQTNCLRHFIPECEEQLQAIQRQREKGLLYGIPVSIKEHIGHKGHLSTCGLVQCLGTVVQEDSVLVKVLKRQGAIPFAMTNVPQSLFNYDCSNPIFGQTLNPFNHQKSPGGSSGGEGALVAGGGSILGIGSDIGGSIRLPSSFCGLCGLKPTAKRLSLSGVSGPVSGILAVPCALGPMARDVDSLALCMKALLCQEMFQLDPTVPPIPFDEEAYSSSAPLRIGYYDTDDYFPLPPCMRRAVRETRGGSTGSWAPGEHNHPTRCPQLYSSPLKSPCRNQLVPFSPPRVHYVMTELFLKTFFADGGRAWLDVFTGGIVDPSLKSQVNCCKIPRLGKKLLALILKPLFPRLADYLSALAGVRSVKEMWNHHHEIEAYRTEFIAWWRELQLDVVLCPVLGPAFTTGYPGKLLTAISSTMLYNVLNFPAGVVPVSTVTEADEEELKLYQGCCDDPWDRTLKQAVAGAVGLPVAVQCVALPWQEELCLRFMKEVETLSREKRAA
ncbi:uncharacterized protein J5M81_005595 [Pluvialis apricaria]